MFDPEKVPAYLRTVVPTLWGGLIAWLLVHASWIPVEIAEYLKSDPVVVVVSGLAVLAWYALWRKVEPRLPAWFTRIVLGSNLSPTYSLGDPRA